MVLRIFREHVNAPLVGVVATVVMKSIPNRPVMRDSGQGGLIGALVTRPREIRI
jgi:hypothetical protein